jgi:hypothetical protein
VPRYVSNSVAILAQASRIRIQLTHVCVPALVMRTRSAELIGRVLPPSESAQQNHTIGIPGGDSPTAVRTAVTLWHSLVASTILCDPVLEVSSESFGDGNAMLFVWVIVWWHPIGRYRGMLRPAQWHSTLVRATVRAAANVDTLTRLRDFERTLSDVLQRSLGSRPYPLHVTRAPWRQSWNFGLADDALQLCTILRLLADRLLRQLAGISLQEHRDLHISWH